MQGVRDDAAGRRAPAVRRMWRRLRGFAADRRGAVAVLAAILFPVVIGGIGLGVETGYWYVTQRKLQHAADVAVHAAAVRNRAGDSQSEMETAALTVAEVSGYFPDRGTLTLSIPPTSGAFAGDPDAVEVIVTEDWARWFSGLFATGAMTLRGRAVAKIINHGGNACVLALSVTASPGVNVTGSTSVTLNGCEVASNSTQDPSVSVGGSGSITTDCVVASGEVSATDGLVMTNAGCPKVQQPAITDPYAGLAEPDLSTIGCSTSNKNVGTPSTSVTVTPDQTYGGFPMMRYCGGLMVKGNVTFSPGLYIISGGDFTAQAGTCGSSTCPPPIISGDNVTFYVDNTSSLKLNGNSQLDLSAPTPGNGAYPGILFFGDRAGTGGSTINGTNGTSLDGAIYMSETNLSYSGNSTSGGGGCTQVIAYTVTFIGNSTMESDCSLTGTSTIYTSEPVAIVE